MRIANRFKLPVAGSMRGTMQILLQVMMLALMPARAASVAAILGIGCLGLAGCDRTPRQPPTTPKPPRPQMSADGYPKSLLGNAILSNALLRYQVQCNARKETVRICRIPQSGAPYRDAGDT